MDATATIDFDHAHEATDLGQLDPSWAGIRVEWLELAGTRTRVLRRGTKHPTASPTLVCVHGLGGSAANFVEVMAPFGELGDVVALDLPGFGECPPQAGGIPPTPDNNAVFLADALDRLALGPVVLVGNSMGGLVATLLAASRPDLVAALVLLGPALPAHLPAVRFSGYQIRAFGPMLVPVLGPKWMRWRLGRMTYQEQYLDSMQHIVARPDELPERVVRLGVAGLARIQVLRWRGRALREATEGLLRLLSPGKGKRRVLAAMQAVESPTLYLRGDRDTLVMHATTVLCRRLGLGWTIEEPAGLGHVLQVEAPEWLAVRVTDFLAERSVT